ncbi:hypothetical protein LBMAG53_06840 [Planctomycetota bacterium]|nr:hypothetical protein LBMAG53_06840 [Planctomycetota bacterium]
MSTFPIDDVRDIFSTDMHAVLEILRGQVTALAASDVLRVAAAEAAERSALAESAEDGCHTITGSASLVGANALAGAAGDLRQTLSAMRTALADLAAAADRAQRLGTEASARLTGFDRLLDLELEKRRDEADALAASLNRAAEGQEESFAFADDPEPMVVVVPEGGDALDPAVLEAFSGEAAELLDLMDRQALLLEGGDQTALAEVMRAYHTLKGAANTVGLDRVGVVAHRVEDLLESIPAGQVAPDLPNRLIAVQRTIRRWLARGGHPSAEELSEALARIQVRPAQDPSSTTVPEVRPEPEGNPASDGANPAERRYLRVSADHLDGLMHLAGELVQGRSRLLSRTGRMVELHRDLRLSRERLGSVIGSFRDRHEFGGLDGKGGPPAAGRADPIAHRFTELELDRYEDIHILSRALGEVGNDVHEIQRQISQAISEVVEDAEGFGRVVGGIQTGITRARLVPVAQLFTRLHLTARDAAARLGKDVQVVSSGEEVALDKGIIDGIQAALFHLVRNAVAHGIEAVDARTAAGKTAQGVITLSARSEAGQILLSVRDDGGGLDLPALHRRGVSLGLIPPATPVDSPTVRDLVFMPGLSTTGAADAVSGRGVGCDAARRDIQRLGGALTVTSTPGSGTVFTATLPLTLAITRALLLRHGDQGYAVPMTFVEHLLDLDNVTVSRSGGIERIPWGAQHLILHDLGAILGLPTGTHRRSGGPVLILHLGDQRWALRVDALSTQTDIVVSSLGELLQGHPLFSGVTITGAGELVPILDVAGLFTAQRTQAFREPVPAFLPVASEPRPAVRVLVADDSVSVRTVMANQLRALGAEAILAVDGEDALDRLRQRPVDLVLTDLEMPKMHGYDLIRSIRSSPAWNGLPVVVVTSRSGDKHRTLAMSVGASDFLSKPFTQEALGGILAKWVKRP